MIKKAMAMKFFLNLILFLSIWLIRSSEYIFHCFKDFDEYFDEKQVMHVTRYENKSIIRYAMLLYDPEVYYENYISTYDKKTSTWLCQQFLKIHEKDNLIINKIDDPEVIDHIQWLFKANH